MCRKAAKVDVFDAQIADIYREFKKDIDAEIGKAFKGKPYLVDSVSSLDGEYVHAKRMIELYQLPEERQRAVLETAKDVCLKEQIAGNVGELFGHTGSGQNSSP